MYGVVIVRSQIQPIKSTFTSRGNLDVKDKKDYIYSPPLLNFQCPGLLKNYQIKILIIDNSILILIPH